MALPALVVPRNQVVVNRSTGRMDTMWQQWADNVVAYLVAMSPVLGSFSGTAQSGAIAQTEIETGTLATGSYRVSYGLQVTQAASVSSNVQVTLRWTSNGQGFSFVGTSIVNGGLTSQVTQMVPVISVDASTTVDYEVSYSSAGATPMKYQLTVVLEQLPVSS